MTNSIESLKPAFPVDTRLKERGCVVPIRDRAEFAALGSEWDGLHQRMAASLFISHAFFKLWLKHFAPDADLRCLAARDAHGRLRAALPLLQQRRTWHGLEVRELCATANVHSCRYDLLAENADVAASEFLDALLDEPDWDSLSLCDVPENGQAYALIAAAQQRGLPVGVWNSIRSPYLPLAPDAGYEPTSKFRANLRRRRRRLGELGEVSLQCVEGGDAMLSCLAEGLQLEASGWKAAAGTALVQSQATLGFYTDLALLAAARGELRLWFLRLDGRAIAFQYGLQHRDTYLLLKPAYDESLSSVSPGQLLMESVIDDCRRRGLHEFDFLGEDMPWKRDWTPHTRPHVWLHIYRGARGRLLHALKFRAAPLLKRLRCWP